MSKAVASEDRRFNLATFDMASFARRGAEARLAELNQEIAAIYSAFPELRRRGSGEPRTRSVNPETQEKPVRRARRTMTLAQRKAVGERMKRYWAARRSQSAAKKR